MCMEYGPGFGSDYEDTPAFDFIKKIIVITVSVAILIFALSVAMTILTRQEKQPKMIQSQPLEPQQRVSTSSTLAEASYENIDPGNADGNLSQNEQNEKPDTVYCVLEPIPASASNHTEENQERDQVNTVYSVIKKPHL